MARGQEMKEGSERLGLRLEGVKKCLLLWVREGVRGTGGGHELREGSERLGRGGPGGVRVVVGDGELGGCDVQRG